MTLHFGGRAVEGQQVVLKNLYPLEAGGGSCLELLVQRAGEGNLLRVEEFLAREKDSRPTLGKEE